MKPKKNKYGNVLQSCLPFHQSGAFHQTCLVVRSSYDKNTSYNLFLKKRYVHFKYVLKFEAILPSFFILIALFHIGDRFQTRAKILYQSKAIKPPPPPPRQLRLLSVLRRWFCCCRYIVLSTSHCLLGFCVGLCFCMHYFMSFLVLHFILTRKRGLKALLLLSFGCLVTINVL